MSERFPDVDWYCDNCDAHLNHQSAFDDQNDVWKCVECGHKNEISANVIFDPYEFLANFDPKKYR